MRTGLKGAMTGYEGIRELGKYNRNITGKNKCYKWPTLYKWNRAGQPLQGSRA